MNVNRTVIPTPTSITPTSTSTACHTAFNGGAGGIQARPTTQEQQWSHENHIAPTAEQQNHVQTAHADHSNFASANGGHPVNAAFSRPGSTAGAVRSVGAPATATASDTRTR